MPAAFAYKQLLHAPFMGGGIWTAASIGLTESMGNGGILVISIVVLALWLLLWRYHLRPQYPGKAVHGSQAPGDTGYVVLEGDGPSSMELQK